MKERSLNFLIISAWLFQHESRLYTGSVAMAFVFLTSLSVKVPLFRKGGILIISCVVCMFCSVSITDGCSFFPAIKFLSFVKATVPLIQYSFFSSVVVPFDQ